MADVTSEVMILISFIILLINFAICPYIWPEIMSEQNVIRWTTNVP